MPAALAAHFDNQVPIGCARPRYQFRRDLQSRPSRRYRTPQLSQAEDFAARNILNPPTEQQMLEIFTRAAFPTEIKMAHSRQR
jgi:hypothetical protein